MERNEKAIEKANKQTARATSRDGKPPTAHIYSIHAATSMIFYV